MQLTDGLTPQLHYDSSFWFFFSFAVEELGGESVSAKITELAKKNKQLCVQVERERTISRQSQTRIKALEEEVRSFII